MRVCVAIVILSNQHSVSDCDYYYPQGCELVIFSGEMVEIQGGAAQTPLMDQGRSAPVISSTKAGSGLCSMTWKCSTACTDLSDLQFLNHTTCRYEK